MRVCRVSMDQMSVTSLISDHADRALAAPWGGPGGATAGAPAGNWPGATRSGRWPWPWWSRPGPTPSATPSRRPGWPSSGPAAPRWPRPARRAVWGWLPRIAPGVMTPPNHAPCNALSGPLSGDAAGTGISPRSTRAGTVARLRPRRGRSGRAEHGPGGQHCWRGRDRENLPGLPGQPGQSASGRPEPNEAHPDPAWPATWLPGRAVQVAGQGGQVAGQGGQVAGQVNALRGAHQDAACPGGRVVQVDSRHDLREQAPSRASSPVRAGVAGLSAAPGVGAQVAEG